MTRLSKVNFYPLQWMQSFKQLNISLKLYEFARKGKTLCGGILSTSLLLRPMFEVRSYCMKWRETRDGTFHSVLTIELKNESQRKKTLVFSSKTSDLAFIESFIQKQVQGTESQTKEVEQKLGSILEFWGRRDPWASNFPTNVLREISGETLETRWSWRRQ